MLLACWILFGSTLIFLCTFAGHAGCDCASTPTTAAPVKAHGWWQLPSSWAFHSLECFLSAASIHKLRQCIMYLKFLQVYTLGGSTCTACSHCSPTLIAAAGHRAAELQVNGLSHLSMLCYMF
jgi:hypothetical protein